MTGIPSKGLWAPRSVEDTLKLYADWADSYDAAMDQMSYATPGRVAQALAQVTTDRGPVLDFGCGTGLSGLALRAQGFEVVDGTDISAEMLEEARAKGAYRDLWLGTPGEVSVTVGDYASIAAVGVVSLGAAPPAMLDVLLNALTPGGYLAFSFNDPTLQDDMYLDALANALDSGKAVQRFREHGPHLSEKVTGSDVIVLERL